MTGGFESTHRSFALTRWLIGVLGPIARAFVLPMLDAAQDVLFRCSVLPLSVVDNSGTLRSTSDDGQVQVLVRGSIDRERMFISRLL
jgi:hypothetical protein